MDGRWAGRHAAERRPDVRRLPTSRVARPDRPGCRRPASPADHRRSQRPPSAVLARRSFARVHLGSAAAVRAGARTAQGGQGSRGQRPGPRAAARRTRRSTPADRPASRRGGLRMVTRQPVAGGRIDVPRPDPRRGRAPARNGTQAATRRAARIGLSLHRPAELHAERPGFPVRPHPPPVAGRGRDGRRDTPHRGPRVRHGARLVARRQAHRVRVRAPPRPRPDTATGHPRGRCRHARCPPRRGRTAIDVRHADVAPRRADHRGARQQARGARRKPERHLGVPGRWLGGARRRWSQHLGSPRPDARRRRRDRHHAR